MDPRTTLTRRRMMMTLGVPEPTSVWINGYGDDKVVTYATTTGNQFTTDFFFGRELKAGNRSGTIWFWTGQHTGVYQYITLTRLDIYTNTLPTQPCNFMCGVYTDPNEPTTGLSIDWPVGEWSAPQTVWTGKINIYALYFGIGSSAYSYSLRMYGYRQ